MSGSCRQNGDSPARKSQRKLNGIADIRQAHGGNTALLLLSLLLSRAAVELAEIYCVLRFSATVRGDIKAASVTSAKRSNY